MQATVFAHLPDVDAVQHDRVVDATALTYRAHGHAVALRARPEGASPGAQFDVVVPALRTIEEVETRASLAEVDPGRLAATRARGWLVTVLVPLDELGAAHRVLHDACDLIQAYWFEDDAVRFGATRVP